MLTDRIRLFAACIFAWVALFIALLPALAQAQSTPDTVVFGPTQYLRSGSAPNEYAESFTLPSHVTAPYLLRVVNGEASGANRISSAWITVNGVQVAGPNDFGQNVAQVERALTLQANNTLEVRVASTPGAYLTITVLATRIPTVPTTLSPNPLAITAGAAGTLTAALAPPPIEAGTLAMASANPAIASVPASVAFGAGQTGVEIPVTAIAEGSTAVTASLNGGTASATVQVTPRPATVTGLAPASVTVTQGGATALTVTLNAAQPSDTTIALASSAPGIASAPASVTVAAGSPSAPFSVFAISPGTAQITAELNGSTAASQVTVVPAPPALVSLLPSTTAATPGATATLTATLSAAQPGATDIVIATSPAGIVSAPAQVTVPAGRTTVTVPVATQALGAAMVQAELNGTRAASAVQVVPSAPAVSALQPSPLTLAAGATGKLTVRLNAAQPAHTEVALSGDPPAVIQVPASVTVPAGQTSAAFTATALAEGDAVVSATLAAGAQSAEVRVIPPPPALVSLTPNPLPLQQAATGNLTLTLNAGQPQDTVAAIETSAAAIIEAPAFVTLPAGETAVAFPVTGLLAGAATLTATIESSAVSAGVEITPSAPGVTSIAPAALTLPKGTPGTLTIAVSRAPSAPTAVALTSSDSAVATVPATVTIPAGALTAEFPVMTNGQGSATVTASLDGASASAQVSVTAAELVTLTLSPQAPTAYVSETVAFTLTGTYTDGATQDLTATAAWSSSDPDVATVAAGAATVSAAGATLITATSGSLSAKTTLTALAPPALTLAPASATVRVEEALTLTVASAAPAGPEGLTVSISTAGSGSLDAPASVVIPQDQGSASFTVTGALAGSVTLTVSAPQRLPATAQITVTPKLAITGFTPRPARWAAPWRSAGSTSSPTRKRTRCALTASGRSSPPPARPN